MIQDIYAYGPSNVVLVITDTCATMAKAWAIVEDEFPWISFAPCQTHCPSLLLTDVSKLQEPTAVIKEMAAGHAYALELLPAHRFVLEVVQELERVHRLADLAQRREARLRVGQQSPWSPEVPTSMPTGTGHVVAANM